MAAAIQLAIWDKTNGVLPGKDPVPQAGSDLTKNGEWGRILGAAKTMSEAAHDNRGAYFADQHKTHTMTIRGGPTTLAPGGGALVAADVFADGKPYSAPGTPSHLHHDRARYISRAGNGQRQFQWSGRHGYSSDGPGHNNRGPHQRRHGLAAGCPRSGTFQLGDANHGLSA